MGLFQQHNLQGEWRPVLRQIATLAEHRSGHEDVQVRVNNKIPTARYMFETDTIEFAPKVAFGRYTHPLTVEKAGLDTEEGKQQWPAATGMILHETYHARFSRMSMLEAGHKAFKEDNDTFANGILVNLEEGRIERLGTEMFPKDISFLRSCALQVVLNKALEQSAKEDDKQEGYIDPVTLYLLVAPRAAGKILKKKDAAPILGMIPATLTEEQRGWIDEASEAFTRHQTDAEAVKIAKELADKLRQDHDKSPTQEQIDQFQKMMEIMERMQDQIEGEVSDSATPGEEESDEEARETERQKAERHKTEKKKSDEFFKAGVKRGPTRTRVIEKRRPTTSERQAARKLAEILRRARYKDRKKTTVQSEIPPGRLNVGAAIQKRANPGIAVNRWSEVRRSHVEQPKLHLGVLGDISGSMGGAMEPLGVLAWVLAQAVRFIEGEAAMVYYGQGIMPVLSPGSVPEEVSVYSASDGGHVIGEAFTALNGSLRISEGTGARLLVVVSDAVYGHREQEEAERAVADCLNTGAAVVWLDTTGSEAAVQMCEKTGAKYLRIDESIEKMVDAVGKLCKDALEAVAPA